MGDMSGSGQLVGRAKDVAALRDLLGATRVLTLTGIGGSGKTRLAEEIAYNAAADGPDEVWVVQLADLSDPTLLVHTVAGVVGLQVPSGQWDSSALVGFFARSHALLVLDSCEHLVEAVAALVTNLTAGCPQLSVMCTSLMPLSLSNETVYPVLPLDVPDVSTGPVSAGTIAGFDAVDLFVRRASAAVPDFGLTDENASAIARLVQQLEGIPLALELAAARMRGLAPEVLLERMGEGFVLLDKGFRDAPPRQQSLTASIEGSYRLCSPAEQLLWCRLSVFSGGFEIEAAEKVCAGGPIAAEDVVELVGSLVDQSVLTRLPDDPRRYRLLEPLRQYGAGVLRDNDERQVWQQRHLEWCSGLVEEMDRSWVGPGQLAWLRRLGAEHPNLRIALETAVGDPSTSPAALRICHQLEPYWICNGLFSEARLWADRALALGSGSAGERALAHRLCAWFGAVQMDMDYAAEQVRLGEPLVIEADDDVVLGFHLCGAAMVKVSLHELAEGSELLERSVDAFRRTTHLHGLLESTAFAGLCRGLAEQSERAAVLHHECLAVAKPHGETWVSSYSLWALGLDALATGDLVTATTYEQEALRVSWGLRDYFGSALRIEALSWVAAAENRPERSALLLGCAEVIWRRIRISSSQTPQFAELRAFGKGLARDAAGTAAFEAAFRRGLAMPTELAVAVALEEDSENPADAADLGPLTRREAEVAQLVAEGLSNREIATRLFLSDRTVQSHVQSIFRRLDFGSRSQLAAWVVRRTG